MHIFIYLLVRISLHLDILIADAILWESSNMSTRHFLGFLLTSNENACTGAGRNIVYNSTQECTPINGKKLKTGTSGYIDIVLI